MEYWTGRQLVSLLLPPVLYYEQGDPSKSKTYVVIENGQIIRGRLSKAVIGQNYESLIAHLYHYYEPHHALRMIRQLQKLGCCYLQVWLFVYLFLIILIIKKRTRGLVLGLGTPRNQLYISIRMFSPWLRKPSRNTTAGFLPRHI